MSLILPNLSAQSAARVPSFGVLGTRMAPCATHNSLQYQTTPNTQTDGGRYCRIKHTAMFEMQAVRLVFANWQLVNQSQGEVAGANPILVRASIETNPTAALAFFTDHSNLIAWSALQAYVVGSTVTYNGATWNCIQANTNNAPAAGSAYWQQQSYYPVHFDSESAARDVTINPGQTVVSEIVHLSRPIPKGGVFYTNHLVQPNNGTANTGTYPTGARGTSAASGQEPNGNYMLNSVTGTAPTDYTLSGPSAPTDSVSGAATLFGPIAVLSYPTLDTDEPVVYVLGDSWSTGTGDTGTSSGGAAVVAGYLNSGEQPGGWSNRLLMDNAATPVNFLYAAATHGKSGSAAYYWQDPSFSYHLILAAGCTHAIYCLGINDIAASQTLAQLQANVLQQIGALAALGLRVYLTTVGPQTTSTDNWATVANQTPAAGFGANSVWSQYNAWVLTIPSPAYGAIDVAGAITNTAAGGTNPVGTVWQPGLVYLTDGLGLHPNTQGHIDIATLADVYFAAFPNQPVQISPEVLFGAPQ